MRVRKNNRGSAMIIVIVVIALVSILVSVLYSVATLNLQMKSVDRKAKENFYSAEGMLEQINLGLQNEMSKVAEEAYVEVMQGYNAHDISSAVTDRTNMFNQKLLTELRKNLAVDPANPTDPGSLGYCPVGVLQSFLHYDTSKYTVAFTCPANVTTANDYTVEYTDGDNSLVLKDVEFTYTDAEGFQSVIKTDIRVKAPDLNLLQPSDMPELFEYTMLANKGIVSDGGNTVTIGNNVYAGNYTDPTTNTMVGGIELNTNDHWNFDSSFKLISKGDIIIPAGASLKVGSATDLWANEIAVNGGEFVANGRTYLAGDLVLGTSTNMANAMGSKVTLAGEYYGYGDGTTLRPDDITVAGGESSAILVNGTKTLLDMSGVSKALLSGSAEIGTGKETFDSSLAGVTVTQIERPDSLNDKVGGKHVPIAGVYNIRAVGKDSYWTSDGVIRATKSKEELTARENFRITVNTDGTISLRDINNLNKYVSVVAAAGGSGYELRANADTIGVAEKFNLKTLDDGNGHYVLQSVLNDKYVTVNLATGALTAERDKVTSTEQVFELVWKDYQNATLTDDIIVTYNYVDSGDSTKPYNVEFTLASKQWAYLTDDQAAKMYYSIDGKEYVSIDMTKKQDRRAVMGTIKNVAQQANIQYYFTYIVQVKDSNDVADKLIVTSDTYEHTLRLGTGNVAAIKSATEPAQQTGIADGVYSIQNTSNNRTRYIAAVNSTMQVNSNAVVKYAVINNADGTFYLYDTNSKLYLTYSSSNNRFTVNGNSTANAQKFRWVTTNYAGYYGMELCNADGSAMGNMYVYSNEVKSGWRNQTITYYLSAGDQKPANVETARFRFDWLECSPFIDSEAATLPSDERDEFRTTPAFGMNKVAQNDASNPLDDKAEAYIKAPTNDGVAPYSITGASLSYSVDGGSEVTVAMGVANGEAKYTISGLVHGAKVNYFITCTCSDGVNRQSTRSIYIHETDKFYTVPLGGSNANVNLGESIEVKSNQIAYLVPAECIGVIGGETSYGQNPMTAAKYSEMLGEAASNSELEIVSFTKKVKGLGNRTLGEYRQEGTDGYRTVFKQVTLNGTVSTMVYFYVDFTPENTSRFFREYYNENKEVMEGYMNNYISEIKLPNSMDGWTVRGNLISGVENGGVSEFDWHYDADKALDANMNAEISNDIAEFQRNYMALTSKLTMDYTETNAAERALTPYENLVIASAVNGMPNGKTKYETSYGGSKIGALIYNGDQYIYDDTEKAANGTDDLDIRLILANGNVVVKKDFDGIIIANGTITVTDSVNIASNREQLSKVLQIVVDPTAATPETIVAKFFNGGNSYVLHGSGAALGSGSTGYVSYGECITYENWSKN